MKKIKLVKLFQAIHIDGKVEMSVQQEVPRVGTANQATPDITISEVANGVEFRKKGSESSTFTTWNNIQYIVYEDSKSEKKSEKTKS